MSVIGSNILAGASGQGGGYNLTKSLRFRSSATASLSRTPASATNRKTWTWSAWIKRAEISDTERVFFSAGTDGNNFTALEWISSKLYLQNYTSGTQTITNTTAVYRDASAWYHIVFAIDTTQATSANRAKVYVNGVQQDGFSGSPFSLNQEFWINFTYGHRIGARQLSSADAFSEQYMTEINFVDGQALTPSSFGETSTTTGVWIPKKYTGSYGTNGFYLPFTDTTSTSTLGTDFSGNSNTWTVNNISLTAGSTYDSMTDVPTLTSATTANYCVWSPINKSSTQNVTNGNLTASSSGGTSYGALCATMGVSSGKWYWEMLYTRNGTSNSPVIGFGNDLFTYTNPPSGYLGSDLNAGGVNVINGNAAINGTSTAYGSAIATNDIVMFAMDLDNRKFYVGKNGTWFNSGNPVTQANPWSYSATIVGSTFFPAVNMFNDTGDTNFGQRPFAYTPPTGFVALNTYNLPTPTIGATASTQANDYFDVSLYTGNGATYPSSQSITGLQFQPDFTWIKSRSNAYPNFVFDAVRGAGKELVTNDTAAETNKNQLSAFNSNGFSVAVATDGSLGTNGNGSTFVGWNWKANGSGVTNTAGSITSTVSANTTSGFSIVTYTGNNTASTVGHGLGVAPAMIIVKLRSTTGAWGVYHSSLTPAQVMYLNLNAAVDGSGIWNSTAPTSSVFSVGAHPTSNPSGGTLVAYCFAQVAGYSAFGSYTGNGSTDGPFIFTGFRPRFVMFKRTDAVEQWAIRDTARDTYNATELELFPNLSNAEEDNNLGIDLLSNGFKIRNSANRYNASSGTYIYMAFCESPFRYANAR